MTLTEALDYIAIELPDLPGQLLVNADAYLVIREAAETLLLLESA